MKTSEYLSKIFSLNEKKSLEEPSDEKKWIYFLSYAATKWQTSCKFNFDEQTSLTPNTFSSPKKINDRKTNFFLRMFAFKTNVKDC